MSNIFEWDDNAQKSEEPNGDILPVLSRGEAMGHMADLVYTQNPFMSYLKYNEIQKAESTDERPAIDTKQLNEMYPDLTEPFQEPTKPSVAKIIADRQRLYQEIERNISLGPNDYIQSGLNFGTGLVIGMMDPTVVAGAIAAEAALLRAANSGRVGLMATEAGLAGRAAKGVEFLGQPGFASTATRDVVAGLAEGAATEGMVAAATLQENMPYTTEDFFMNTVGGAVMMPAFAGTVRGLGKGLGKAYDFAINPDISLFHKKFSKMKSMLQVGAKGSVTNGRAPDVESIMRIHEAEMNGRTPEFASEQHKFEMVDLTNTANTSVYSVVNGKNQSGPMSFDFEVQGGALVVTDSARVANGVAGSVFESDYKNIQEFRFTDDLNVAKFTDTLEGTEKTVGQAIKDIKDDIRTGNAEPEALQNYYNQLKEQGFDAVGGKYQDISLTPENIHDHNVMAVFNPDKVEMGKRFGADRKTIGKSPEIIDAQKQKQLEEPELIDPNDIDAVKKDLADADENPIPVEKVRQMDAVIEEQMSIIDDLEALDMLNAEEKAILQNLRQNIKEGETLNTALKVAEVCVK